LIWRFPIRDHSHSAFGQNEPTQSEESPEIGLRWNWRDVGHFFKEEGPLLLCGLVVLNRSRESDLDEQDLFIFREEHNPWLYVNTDNLRENLKEYTVNQNLIKRLREGTSRGKQIRDALDVRKAIHLGRIRKAEDCVAAFLFLASPAMSGYITGQIIHVNGGQLMLG
jgi:hypothetical protein